MNVAPVPVAALQADSKQFFPTLANWFCSDRYRDAKDRRAAAVTAPACGLYFMKVDY